MNEPAVEPTPSELPTSAEAALPLPAQEKQAAPIVPAEQIDQLAGRVITAEKAMSDRIKQLEGDFAKAKFIHKQLADSGIPVGLAEALLPSTTDEKILADKIQEIRGYLSEHVQYVDAKRKSRPDIPSIMSGGGVSIAESVRNGMFTDNLPPNEQIALGLEDRKKSR